MEIEQPVPQRLAENGDTFVLFAISYMNNFKLIKNFIMRILSFFPFLFL